MKPLLLITILCIGFHPGFAQTEWSLQRDSLLQSLSRSKEDTARVMTLLHLGVQYMENQPDSTIYYAETFGRLSRKLHYETGIINSLSMRAAILSGQYRPDEAITLDLEAIRLAQQANLQHILANVYNNIAIIYEEKKEDHSTGLDYYLKALDLYTQLQDSSRMAMAYSNIGQVYNSLKEYKKGYRYSLDGILLYRSLQRPTAIRSGMLALSSSLMALGRYDTALVILRESKALSEELNDKNYAQSILNRLIMIYTKTGRPVLLKNTADELLTLSRSLHSDEGSCDAWAGLSDYYFYRRNYAAAASYNDKIIRSAKADSVNFLLEDAYERMGKIELAKGNLSAYDHYKTLHDSMEELVLSDKILKNTQELEAKYSLVKEQAQIDSLNKEKKISGLILRQHRTMEWALMAILVVFIGIGFLFYTNSQQKKQLLLSEAALQQQKITELEKERQLLTTRSVLLGQDEERKRLAKDLHDGLGGILSVAKYSFNNMKHNLIITPENAIAFDKSMGFLDRSIQELRRVAHNMMPEALVEFGLDTALKDYCNSITNSGVMQVTYQSFEITDDSVPPTMASVIYRIIQELINNTLKHAAATTAVVQLVKRSDALSITVEDNGKGFDTALLKNSTGIGYLNLQNRVSYLQGTIDVQSASGRGTFVSIEIPNIAT